MNLSRRWYTLTATMAVMMETSSGAMDASPAAMAATVSDPIVGIASKCLDDLAASTAEGNPTVLPSCNGSRQQQRTLNGGDRGA
jgi:uncharacterized protein (DUF169 family)